MRHKLAMQSEIDFTDRICRAVGTLKTARKIQTNEAIDCLSMVLIGFSVGYLKGISPEQIWKTEQRIQPAVIGKTANERDKERAKILRELTKQLEIVI